MVFNPDLHHRRSIRLPGYDYAGAGAYFVTLCAHQREPLFGEAHEGEIRLNAFGDIAAEEWLRTGQIRKEVVLGDYVVMPNHLHAIIFAHGEGGSSSRGEAGQGARPRSLGALVGGYKAAVTTRINRVRGVMGKPVWQRNYYEHVIRGDADLARVREYIARNPAQWLLDEENLAP